MVKKPRLYAVLALLILLPVLGIAAEGGKLGIPDGFFTRAAETKILEYSNITSDTIRATYADGPTADIAFTAENPAGNPVPPTSVNGFELVTQPTLHDGLKYGYKLVLPNEQFKGIIHVTCSENLTQAGQCGEMAFSFDDLLQEQNYSGKLMAFSTTQTAIDEKSFRVEISMDSNYGLQVGDPIYLDPKVTLNFSSTEAVLTNMTHDNDAYHLDIEKNTWMELDGVDDRVEVNNASILNVTQNLTVSAWIKPKSNHQNQIVQRGTNNNNGYLLQTWSDGKIYWYIGNGASKSVNSGATLQTLNEWQMVTGTFNGTQLALYKNGVNVGTTTIPLTEIVEPATGFSIAGTSNYFNGSIDDIQIYNRSLSASEISSLYALGRDGGRVNKTGNIAHYRFNDQNNATDSAGSNHGTYEGGASLNAPYGNLVGYWSFDRDSSTTAYDWSGLGNDGTYSNGASPVGECLFDDCASFDASDDYVSVSTMPDNLFQKDFAVSLFVNPKFVGAGDQALIDKRVSGTSGFLFRTENGLLKATFNAETLTSSESLSANKWQHFLVARNGSTVRLYIDGSIVATNNTLDAEANNSNALYFGSRSFSTPALVLNGSIDEVMVFNTSLTASQIEDIYKNQSARFKATGEAVIRSFNISSGYDSVNLSVDYERNKGSNVSLGVGEWDASRGYNFSTENGEVAYFTFDGGLNSSINGINGTPNGDVTTGSGVFSAGLVADGVNDDVSVADSHHLRPEQGNLTVALWVFANQKGVTISPIGKSSGASASSSTGWWFTLGTGGDRWSFITSNASTSSTSQASSADSSADKWVHLVGAWNGTASVLYVDGVAQTAGNNAPEMNLSTSDALRVGSVNAGLDWNGSIDDVIIYNRSLSASEVKDLYVKGRANWSYSDFQNATDNTQTFEYASSSGIAAAFVDSENSTVNGFNATFFGNANWSTQNRGAIGDNVLGLDGTGDYAKLSEGVTPIPDGSPYTLTGWFKRSGVGSSSGAVTTRSIFGYTEQSTSNKWAFYLGNSDPLDTTVKCALSNGTNGEVGDQYTFDRADWNHYGCVWNTSTLSLYVNGELKSSKLISLSGTVPTSVNTGAFTIGGGYEGATTMNGSIDEVAIWNRSLTEAEIQEVYLSSKERHSNNKFSVSTNTTNILPIVKALAGSLSTPFYSPLIESTFLRAFYSEQTGPALTIVSPENITYTGTNISISFTASDTFLDTQWYSVNGGANTTYTAATHRLFGNGQHTIRFYANDTNGNLGQDSVTFSVSEPPLGGPGGFTSRFLKDFNATTRQPWLFGIENPVRVRTFDTFGDPINIDDVHVAILENVTYETVKARSTGLGEYRQDFTIDEKDLNGRTNLTLNITVTDGDKVVSDILIVQIDSKATKFEQLRRDLENKTKAAWQYLLAYLAQNWQFTVGIGVVFVILFVGGFAVHYYGRRR